MKESRYLDEVVCRWVKKAVNDLQAGELLLNEGFLAESAFHSQQAAEKSLKAVLISLGVRPPKTHQIEMLLELLSEKGVDVDSLKRYEPEILSTYAVESRYPDFEEEPSEEEAEEALNIANKVVEWSLSYLRNRGIHC